MHKKDRKILQIRKFNEIISNTVRINTRDVSSLVRCTGRILRKYFNISTSLEVYNCWLNKNNNKIILRCELLATNWNKKFDNCFNNVSPRGIRGISCQTMCLKIEGKFFIVWFINIDDFPTLSRKYNQLTQMTYTKNMISHLKETMSHQLRLAKKNDPQIKALKKNLEAIHQELNKRSLELEKQIKEKHVSIHFDEEAYQSLVDDFGLTT